jgi:hypothetical protein
MNEKKSIAQHSIVVLFYITIYKTQERMYSDHYQITRPYPRYIKILLVLVIRKELTQHHQNRRPNKQTKKIT